MALLHESVREKALMARLMLLRSFRISYHCTLSVSDLFLRNVCESCAFHMSSLVFIDSSSKPRRLCCEISVERLVPQGAVTCRLPP